MRIALFGNGEPAARVAEYLARAGEDICGLVLHPQDHQECADRILAACGVCQPEILTLDAARQETEVCSALKTWKPDLIVSVYYGYLIPTAVLKLAALGGINLHPSFLPYHRGRHPNVWAIVEGTPAGASLHYMSDSFDTGDVIARERLLVSPLDTAQTLYERLADACVELFEKTWPAVRAGTAVRIKQEDLPERPCSHRHADLDDLDEIDLDRRYTGRELLNILRARTFPPYAACWYQEGGHKVYVRVELTDGGIIEPSLTKSADLVDPEASPVDPG